MSYTSLFYHVVLRTKYRERTIDELHENELYAYIMALAKNKSCKVYCINGMPDHVHIFISIHQSISISEFIKVLKGESSKWMKHSGLFQRFRGWCEGYCAISYNIKDKDMICNYIANQKVHHKSQRFEDEFDTLLKEQGIEPVPDYYLKT